MNLAEPLLHEMSLFKRGDTFTASTEYYRLHSIDGHPIYAIEGMNRDDVMGRLVAGYDQKAGMP
jgi:hypothetical protein